MIKVNELIPNAFSREQADILRDKIQEELGKEDVVEIDFDGIKRFTTLFFNFSTGKILTELKNDEYARRIKLLHLSPLGLNTYNNSYENAKNKLADSDDEQKILEILKDPKEEG